MIILYTGTPGSGKSYHMAADIMLQYKRGKYIFTNFEINTDYLHKRYPHSKAQVFQIDNRDLQYPYGLEGFSRNFCKSDKDGRVFERQCYLFIDECQNNFDARQWNIKGRAEWNHWLSEHRKDGFQVYLITQNDADIDKKIRGRIEQEVKHFKINNFKIFGQVLAVLCGGNLFSRKCYWYTKGKSSSDVISFDLAIGHKRYFKIFNTSKRFLRTFTERPVWVDKGGVSR
ncbi:MAG: zonular occludens toxin domain-containing protein [Lachnospiraceae bacterium]|nr:zonular occludens toxin domain-containing protein [Lachnospiraceae bacterium]